MHLLRALVFPMLIQRTIAIPLNLAPSLLLPSLPVEPKDFSDSVPSISQHFPLFERGVFPHECAEKATADDESCFTLKGLSDNDMRFALAPGQTFDKGLGGGFRGNVAQCVSETGQDVAVKRYREKDVELAENSFKVSKELLENEHVVKLIAHGKIQNRPALAMELLDGDIMPLVENEEYKGKEKETAFKDVANQFLDGLAYMHSKRIAHTDFHEANIGLKGNTVKIIDFDFACVNKECITGVAGGKKGYASPGKFLSCPSYLVDLLNLFRGIGDRRTRKPD